MDKQIDKCALKEEDGGDAAPGKSTVEGGVGGNAGRWVDAALQAGYANGGCTQ